jgi:hypothetical protein
MRILEMIAGSRGMGDARSMGEMLRRMGRRGDTMLAHITPEEADMLMQAGGSGTTNPMTGLPEFAPRSSFDDDAGDFVRNTQSDILRSIQSQPVSSRNESVPMDIGFESRPLETTVRADQQQQRLYPSVNMAPDIRNVEPTYFPSGQRTAQDFMGPLVPPDEVSSSYTPRGYQIPSYLPEFQPLADQTAVRPAERGFLERAESGIQELRDVLDRYPNLTRAGTAGANILAQALMFNQANQAMRRDIEATRAAAQPFRQAQAEAMSRATGEGLTPEQQQEMEIQQARARQSLGQRGTPTGSAAAGILAAQQRRARSLARQESFGEALRLANIADQYDRRALEMELQRDQQLAQLFAGIVGREVQQSQRTQAPATNQTTAARAT